MLKPHLEQVIELKSSSFDELKFYPCIKSKSALPNVDMENSAELGGRNGKTGARKWDEYIWQSGQKISINDSDLSQLRSLHEKNDSDQKYLLS